MTRESRHLHVCKLPTETTDEKVQEFFTSFGRVHKVSRLSPSRAVVSFMDLHSAQKANGEHKINGGQVQTTFYDQVKPPPKSSTPKARYFSGEPAGTGSSSTASTPQTVKSEQQNVPDMDYYERRSGSTSSRAKGPAPSLDNSNSSRSSRYGQSSVSARRAVGARVAPGGDHQRRSRQPAWDERSNTDSQHSRKSNNSSGGRLNGEPSRKLEDRPRSSHRNSSASSTSTDCSLSPSHSCSSLGSKRSGKSGVDTNTKRSGAVGTNEASTSDGKRSPVNNLDVSANKSSLSDTDMVLTDSIDQHHHQHTSNDASTARHSTNARSRKSPEPRFSGTGSRLNGRRSPDRRPRRSPSFHSTTAGTRGRRSPSHEPQDLDVLGPRSSRTLYVGNLERRVGDEGLKRRFGQYGQILDIEVKNRETPAPFAFIQYADIGAVVKAVKEQSTVYKSDKSKMKVGFGRTIPCPLVWLDGLPADIDEEYLKQKMKPYGDVKDLLVDHFQHQALVTYTTERSAEEAVKQLKGRGRTISGVYVQVDYGSQSLQDVFVDRMFRHKLLAGKSATTQNTNNRHSTATTATPTAVKDTNGRRSLSRSHSNTRRPSSRSSDYSRRHNTEKNGPARPHDRRQPVKDGRRLRQGSADRVSSSRHRREERNRKDDGQREGSSSGASSTSTRDQLRGFPPSTATGAPQGTSEPISISVKSPDRRPSLNGPSVIESSQSSSRPSLADVFDFSWQSKLGKSSSAKTSSAVQQPSAGPPACFDEQDMDIEKSVSQVKEESINAVSAEFTKRRPKTITMGRKVSSDGLLPSSETQQGKKEIDRPVETTPVSAPMDAGAETNAVSTPSVSSQSQDDSPKAARSPLKMAILPEIIKSVAQAVMEKKQQTTLANAAAAASSQSSISTTAATGKSSTSGASAAAAKDHHRNAVKDIPLATNHDLGDPRKACISSPRDDDFPLPTFAMAGKRNSTGSTLSPTKRRTSDFASVRHIESIDYDDHSHSFNRSISDSSELMLSPEPGTGSSHHFSSMTRPSTDIFGDSLHSPQAQGDTRAMQERIRALDAKLLAVDESLQQTKKNSSLDYDRSKFTIKKRADNWQEETSNSARDDDYDDQSNQARLYTSSIFEQDMERLRAKEEDKFIPTTSSSRGMISDYSSWTPHDQPSMDESSRLSMDYISASSTPIHDRSPSKVPLSINIPPLSMQSATDNGPLSSGQLVSPSTPLHSILKKKTMTTPDSAPAFAAHMVAPPPPNFAYPPPSFLTTAVPPPPIPPGLPPPPSAPMVLVPPMVHDPRKATLKSPTGPIVPILSSSSSSEVHHHPGRPVAPVCGNYGDPTPRHTPQSAPPHSNANNRPVFPPSSQQKPWSSGINSSTTPTRPVQPFRQNSLPYEQPPNKQLACSNVKSVRQESQDVCTASSAYNIDPRKPSRLTTQHQPEKTFGLRHNEVKPILTSKPIAAIPPKPKIQQKEPRNSVLDELFKSNAAVNLTSTRKELPKIKKIAAAVVEHHHKNATIIADKKTTTVSVVEKSAVVGVKEHHKEHKDTHREKEKVKNVDAGSDTPSLAKKAADKDESKPPDKAEKEKPSKHRDKSREKERKSDGAGGEREKEKGDKHKKTKDKDKEAASESKVNKVKDKDKDAKKEKKRKETAELKRETSSSSVPDKKKEKGSTREEPSTAKSSSKSKDKESAADSDGKDSAKKREMQDKNKRKKKFSARVSSESSSDSDSDSSEDEYGQGKSVFDKDLQKLLEEEAKLGSLGLSMYDRVKRRSSAVKPDDTAQKNRTLEMLKEQTARRKQQDKPDDGGKQLKRPKRAQVIGSSSSDEDEDGNDTDDSHSKPSRAESQQQQPPPPPRKTSATNNKKAAKSSSNSEKLAAAQDSDAKSDSKPTSRKPKQQQKKSSSPKPKFTRPKVSLSLDDIFGPESSDADSPSPPPVPAKKKRHKEEEAASSDGGNEKPLKREKVDHVPSVATTSTTVGDKTGKTAKQAADKDVKAVESKEKPIPADQVSMAKKPTGDVTPSADKDKDKGKEKEREKEKDTSKSKDVSKETESKKEGKEGKDPDKDQAGKKRPCPDGQENGPDAKKVKKSKEERRQSKEERRERKRLEKEKKLNNTISSEGAEPTGKFMSKGAMKQLASPPHPMSETVDTNEEVPNDIRAALLRQAQEDDETGSEPVNAASSIAEVEIADVQPGDRLVMMDMAGNIEEVVAAEPEDEANERASSAGGDNQQEEHNENEPAASSSTDQQQSMEQDEKPSEARMKELRSPIRSPLGVGAVTTTTAMTTATTTTAATSTAQTTTMAATSSSSSSSMDTVADTVAMSTSTPFSAMESSFAEVKPVVAKPMMAHQPLVEQKSGSGCSSHVDEVIDDIARGYVEIDAEKLIKMSKSQQAMAQIGERSFSGSVEETVEAVATASQYNELMVSAPSCTSNYTTTSGHVPVTSMDSLRMPCAYSQPNQQQLPSQYYSQQQQQQQQQQQHVPSVSHQPTLPAFTTSADYSSAAIRQPPISVASSMAGLERLLGGVPNAHMLAPELLHGIHASQANPVSAAQFAGGQSVPFSTYPGSMPFNLPLTADPQQQARAIYEFQQQAALASRLGVDPMEFQRIQLLQQQQQQHQQQQRMMVNGGAELPTSEQSIPLSGRQIENIPTSNGPSQQSGRILERYPIRWQGHLALKNFDVLIQMNLISGNVDLVGQSMIELKKQDPQQPHNGTAEASTIRINQRMRLEQGQLEGVQRRMDMPLEHCVLLGLPCGHTPEEIVANSQKLREHFIDYLAQKQAAGIVNVSSKDSEGGCVPTYVVHVFPPCDFSNAHLQENASDVLASVQERNTSYLFIVITTVQGTV